MRSSRSTEALMSTPTATEQPAKVPISDGDANHARRWWILAVLGVAQLMVILDNTIVNIALPTAQHALNFSNADRQWVVTGYSLAFGNLLLLGGRNGGGGERRAGAGAGQPQRCCRGAGASRRGRSFRPLIPRRARQGKARPSRRAPPKIPRS